MNWVKQHRLPVIIVLACVLVIMGAVVWLKLTADSAAQQYNQRIARQQKAVKQSFERLADLAKQANPEVDNAQKLHTQLKQLNAGLQGYEGRPVTLPPVPGSTVLSQAHARAEQDDVQVRLEALAQASQDMLAYSTFQQSLQSILSGNSLFAPVKGQADAKASRAAWASAAEKMQDAAVAGNQRLQPIRDDLHANMRALSSTFKKLEKAYSKGDRKALQQTRDKLKAQLATLRGNTDSLQEVGRALEQALAAALRGFLGTS